MWLHSFRFVCSFFIQRCFYASFILFRHVHRFSPRRVYLLFLSNSASILVSFHLYWKVFFWMSNNFSWSVEMVRYKYMEANAVRSTCEKYSREKFTIILLSRGHVPLRNLLQMLRPGLRACRYPNPGIERVSSINRELEIISKIQYYNN
jgi:hypothetical protein